MRITLLQDHHGPGMYLPAGVTTSLADDKAKALIDQGKAKLAPDEPEDDESDDSSEQDAKPKRGRKKATEETSDETKE